MPYMPGAVVTPYDFGGDPADADSTTAVQAMIDAARNSYESSTESFRLVADLVGERWKVSTIDATDIRRGFMTIRNGTLYGTTAGKVVLDLSGSNRLELYDLRIHGDEANPPAIGLLLSRALESNYSISPQHKIIALQTGGKFSKAAVVNFASEVISWTNCNIVNEHRSVDAYCLVISGHAGTLNEFIGGVSSEFVTLPTAATGSHSCILHDLGHIKLMRTADVNMDVTNVSKTNPAVVTVDPGELAAAGFANGDQVFFRHVAGMNEIDGKVFTISNLNTGAGTFALSGTDATGYGTFTEGKLSNRTGPALLVSDCVGVKTRAAYALTYGSDPIVVDLKQGDVTSLDFDIKLEAKCPAAVRFNLPLSGVGVVRDLSINTLSTNLANATNFLVLSTGGGTGTIRVEGLKFIMPYLTSSSSKVFASPAMWDIRDADMRLPLEAPMDALPGSFIGFKGSLFYIDTNKRVNF
jgi:hypothetical protein